MRSHDEAWRQTQIEIMVPGGSPRSSPATLYLWCRNILRELQGATAIVTGAGSGIGLAVAAALAEQRVQLALVDNREERLAEASEGFQPSGFGARSYVCDVAWQEEVKCTASRILADMGSVQLLLNCAGVAHAGRFAESSIEDWEWLLGVNLWGTVYFTHALLPHLLEQPNPKNL